jgi:hypothetical protein
MLPGVTDETLQLAVNPEGRPETVRSTTPSKAPPMGVTVTSTLAEPPAVNVNGVCGAVTAKLVELMFVTVSMTADDVEPAKSALPE